MNFPEIGSLYKFDGINWSVVGAGDIFFEYKGNKGIFSLINLELMDCLVVLIEEREILIAIDPSIPSVKVNGEEILIEYRDRGSYVLLKYEREYN